MLEEVIVLEVDGRQYEFCDESWCQLPDYRLAPSGLIPELNFRAERKVQSHFEQIGSMHGLLTIAKSAMRRDDWSMAILVARQAFDRERSHGTATVLCSALRSAGQPAKAVEVAQQFEYRDYAPLLTTLSAAHCDLEHWEVALQIIRRALAISKPGRANEALAVHARIKKHAPRLFPRQSTGVC